MCCFTCDDRSPDCLLLRSTEEWSTLLVRSALIAAYKRPKAKLMFVSVSPPHASLLSFRKSLTVRQRTMSLASSLVKVLVRFEHKVIAYPIYILIQQRSVTALGMGWGVYKQMWVGSI